MYNKVCWKLIHQKKVLSTVLCYFYPKSYKNLLQAGRFFNKAENEVDETWFAFGRMEVQFLARFLGGQD